jgi:hypothetical protein
VIAEFEVLLEPSYIGRFHQGTRTKLVADLECGIATVTAEHRGVEQVDRFLRMPWIRDVREFGNEDLAIEPYVVDEIIGHRTIDRPVYDIKQGRHQQGLDYQYHQDQSTLDRVN